MCELSGFRSLVPSVISIVAVIVCASNSPFQPAAGGKGGGVVIEQCVWFGVFQWEQQIGEHHS